MARVTGPLMSFDASGTLAKSMVFAKWRGRNYVRRHAIPANPRSINQIGIRSMFAWLAQEWKLLASGDHTAWSASPQ